MNQRMPDSLRRLPLAAPAPPEVHDQDLDMMAIVRVFHRRIGFIFFITVLLSVLALPVIMAIEPEYQARARFLMQPMLPTDAATQNEILDLDDEVQRLRARDIADRIIDRFDLAQSPEFNPALRPKHPLRRAITALRGGTATEETDPTDIAQRVLAAFYDRISVWREADSNVIQIDFTSVDPQHAANIPNAMIDVYRVEREAKYKNRIRQVLASIDTQVETQKANLAMATEAIKAFQEESGVTSVGRSDALDGSRVVLVNEQLADIQRQRIELGSRIATAEAALAGEAVTAIGETDTLTDLRLQLQVRKRELNRLTARYGEGYGGVLAERSRIAEIENALREELTAWIATLKAQSVQMELEEAALLKTRSDVTGLLASTSVAELELINLVRRADAQRDVLERFEGQKRATEARLLDPSLDLEIISPALPPIYPEGRGRKSYLAITALASAMFAVTLAGLMDVTDRTVRSPQQLAGRSNLRPVGMLPGIRSWFRMRSCPPDDPRMKDALRGAILAMESIDGGDLPRSMMITTARSLEGAATVARDLAGELATSGQGVLLVDAMTPRRRFGRAFTGKMPLGLAEYLRCHGTDNVLPDQLLDRLIATDTRDGIHVLPRGNGPLPALYDSAPILPLLEYAAARQLLVFFICPPILTSASIVHIARTVDRVLLVMRWGVTLRASVHLAAERLRAGGIGTILTVLDRVDPKRHALYPFHDATTFTKPKRSESW